MQKSKAVKAILLVIVCVSFGMGVPRLLNISTSDSMKDHVFVLRPFNKDVGNGTIVRYPHQDAVTEGKTLYMLKRVACASGQHLTADSIKKEYYCDGKYLARAKSVSAKGIPVQNFVYDGIIPEEIGRAHV